MFIFASKDHIYWYIKNQTIVETSMFDAEFCATKFTLENGGSIQVQIAYVRGTN